MYECKECNRSFMRRCDLTQHRNFQHSENKEELKKRSAKSYSIKKEIKSIYDVSSRTAKKILNRLNIGCSNCGWNEASCDTHHIIEKNNGGSNDHSNLTYLCPNCHRLAHYGKIPKYITLEEQIGDKWKEFYYSV